MTPEREAQMREMFAEYMRAENIHGGYVSKRDFDAGFLACARALEPMVRDGERLDWMSERGAWIAWSKDYECCRVFVPTDDGGEPALGWGAGKSRHTAREAIDAAMSAALEDGNATE